MDRFQSFSPLDATGLASRGDLLAPVIRRDIADLNRQYLTLTLASPLRDDPRFRLPACSQPGLEACSADARERLALCPFSLFELRLPEPVEALPVSTARVADTQGDAVADPATEALCTAFALLSLSVARQLAEAWPLAPRIALGVSPAVEARLAGMRPSDLWRLAKWPGLIRPRWAHHDRYWRMLIGAAQTPEPDPLRRAHCVGLCLLAGAPVGAIGGSPSAPRRRLGLSRARPGVEDSC
jgi:hypothetical protein